VFNDNDVSRCAILRYSRGDFEGFFVFFQKDARLQNGTTTKVADRERREVDSKHIIYYSSQVGLLPRGPQLRHFATFEESFK